jgi:PAS domain S-box-containing protein
VQLEKPLTRELPQSADPTDAQFRLLVESVTDYAIFLLDTTGRVMSWNPGAERAKGYAASEILGRHFSVFYPAEDREARIPEQLLQRAAREGRVSAQGWRVRKDGSRFWADVVITALRNRSGLLSGYAKVTRDLTDRRRVEELEKAERQTNEFLAMLAHELRNPLAPVRNAVTIMAATPGLPPQVAWSRDVIERQTAQLARIVDDLLDVSRITRGKLRLQSAPIDVEAAIQRAVEASRPLIDARHHRLELDVPAGLAVYGDMARLTQVFLNILNNAAKYTPERGEIRVHAGVEGNDVVVRVRDTGVGIPQSLIDHVFDLFAQGERTLDRSEGGLGIGLTLARRIVALHGGTIGVRSEGAGRGAEFEVRLPRLAAPAQLSLSGESPKAAVPQVTRRAILVVDDNVDAANSMAMLLRMGGHEVEVAHDGPTALDRVSAHLPDVVLLDIGLPGMSGYQVAEQLRARYDRSHDLRIYAMTGYGQAQDRDRSLESGFDGHLVKPVLPDDLFRLIENPAVGARAPQQLDKLLPLKDN